MLAIRDVGDGSFSDFDDLGGLADKEWEGSRKTARWCSSEDAVLAVGAARM